MGQGNLGEGPDHHSPLTFRSPWPSLTGSPLGLAPARPNLMMRRLIFSMLRGDSMWLDDKHELDD